MTTTTVRKQLTPQDVAELLHISTQTLRKHARRTDFPQPARVGRKLLYDPGEVSAYLDRQRQGGAHGS